MYRSHYYQNIAQESYNNAYDLMESANLLINGKSKHHAIFFILTACEELEKSIYCLWVTMGILNNQQINKIFKLHQAKIFLYPIIYSVLKIKNGKFFVDAEPLENLDLNLLVKKFEKPCSKYNRERESFLYVEPNPSGCHIPKKHTDFGMGESFYRKRFDGLSGFIWLIANYDLQGDIGNFKLFERQPKDKPLTQELHFAGSGEANKKQFPLIKTRY